MSATLPLARKAGHVQGQHGESARVLGASSGSLLFTNNHCVCKTRLIHNEAAQASIESPRFLVVSCQRPRVNGIITSLGWKRSCRLHLLPASWLTSLRVTVMYTALFKAASIAGLWTIGRTNANAGEFPRERRLLSSLCTYFRALTEALAVTSQCRCTS